LVDPFGFVAGVFVVCESEALLEDVELSPACAPGTRSVMPAAASAEMGVSTITALRALASQRVPIDAGLTGGTGLEENATFILPLYDDFGG
jgi:hypothetical protein